MIFKEIKSIAEHSSLECNICHSYMSMNNEIILNSDEMLILGISELGYGIKIPRDDEVIVICPNCFRGIMRSFQEHHNTENFIKWCEDIKIEKEFNEWNKTRKEIAIIWHYMK